MANLSAVLFVLGMTGLAVVVGLHQAEEDAWQKAADAAFLEQKEAIDALNEPRTPSRSSYQHADNGKYIAELSGCIAVLVLAAAVRYRSPRREEPVRAAEKWARSPRQPKPRQRARSERRQQAAAKSPPELADRVSAVVWSDRAARKETLSGTG